QREIHARRGMRHRSTRLKKTASAQRRMRCRIVQFVKRRRKVFSTLRLTHLKLSLEITLHVAKHRSPNPHFLGAPSRIIHSRKADFRSHSWVTPQKASDQMVTGDRLEK